MKGPCLGCIEAYFCNRILILQRFSRSTRISFLCTFGVEVGKTRKTTPWTPPKKKSENVENNRVHRRRSKRHAMASRGCKSEVAVSGSTAYSRVATMNRSKSSSLANFRRIFFAIFKFSSKICRLRLFKKEIAMVNRFHRIVH